MATNTVAAAQKATLDRFIEGWAAWTPEGILGTWADNCTQQNLPLSANLEVKTRQRAEQSLPVLISILTNFEVSPPRHIPRRSLHTYLHAAQSPQCRA